MHFYDSLHGSVANNLKKSTENLNSNPAVKKKFPLERIGVETKIIKSRKEYFKIQIHFITLLSFKSLSKLLKEMTLNQIRLDKGWETMFLKSPKILY